MTIMREWIKRKPPEGGDGGVITVYAFIGDKNRLEREDPLYEFASVGAQVVSSTSDFHSVVVSDVAAPSELP